MFIHITACMLAKFPKEPSTPKASAALLPSRLLQLLPVGTKVTGRDSHPLKDSALTRRTLRCANPTYGTTHGKKHCGKVLTYHELISGVCLVVEWFRPQGETTLSIFSQRPSWAAAFREMPPDPPCLRGWRERG